MGETGFAFVFRSFDQRPVGGPEWDIRNLHWKNPSKFSGMLPISVSCGNTLFREKNEIVLEWFKEAQMTLKND
jgi:hypothetical protein